MSDVATASSLALLSSPLSALNLNSDTLYYGLNFKATQAVLPGMMNRLRKNKGDMDLDIACVLYDKKCNLVDTVWFKSLRDSSESIRHQGDSLNGKDRGMNALYEGSVDPEIIELRLNAVPSYVTHIDLVLTSYKGQPLRRIEAGKLHLSDDEGNPAFEIDLRTLPAKCNGLWVAHLRREVDDWHLTLQVLPTDSNDIPKIAAFVSAELARSLPQPSVGRAL